MSRPDAASAPSRRPPSSWVPARALSAAVEHDPQFRLPRRPRLVDGLVPVALPDGLLLEGLPERQVLRGRAATTLVPRLLEHLDGARDMAGLGRALGDVDPGALRAAVALLYACGALEDGPPANAAVAPAVRAYCSRHVDTTRVNASADEVLARLAAARVAIVDPGGRLAPRLEAALRASGVPNVSLGPPTGAPPTLVAVLADAVEDVAASERVDEECARLGIPWVRFALAGRAAEVGPLFDRAHTACYRCFDASRTVPAPSGTTGAPAELAFVGLVALELVHLLGRVCRAASVRGVTTYALDRFTARSLPLLRRPGCRTCCPGTRGEPAPHPAHAYEQAVAFPPRHLIDPKDHQHHYRAANLALQREAKRYPGARHRALVEPAQTPAPAGALLSDAPARAALDAATLAGLLLRVAGIRDEAADGKVQRWAATGGNLGSVQAYVAAREPTVLAPGWHLYDPHRHALASVAPLRGDLGTLARAASGGELPDDVEALLVLTGALTRVGRKYGEFALRIVCLDAGVAVAQTVALASGYGLAARVASRWDDGLLLDALRLDGDAEPITSLVALSRRTP